MPVIKEVIDSKEHLIDSSGEANYPSTAERKKSQADGATDTGTASQSVNESLADFNQGSGVDVAE